MGIVIYRRANISLALKQNGFTTGVNLYIWYGYISDTTKQDDFIVDASLIKEHMKIDLQEFDHLCIEIKTKYDIVDSMIEIGQMIFAKARSRLQLHEVIVENIYGDEVVIRNSCITIHKKFLYGLNSEGVVFFCNDNKRLRLYGLPFQRYTFTSNKNVTEKHLNEIMLNVGNNMQCFISRIDEASMVISTFYKQESVPQYITFCIIEHIAHQLPNVSASIKCNRLHGHTYRCYVTVNNTYKTPLTSELVFSIGETVRTYLRKAFELKNLSVTSVENVARYLSENLCNEYNIAFIELSETPNIKVRLSIEKGIGGEIYD